jgi:hypothetical protein
VKAPADSSRDGRGGRDTPAPLGQNRQRGAGANPTWTHLALRASTHDHAAPAVAERAAQSGGRPLPPGTRELAEQRLGHDFSDVRIHTDAQAAHAADATQAHAYTIGSDVVFGRGEFDPASERGRALLGHELAHVVQQRGAASAPAVSPRIQRQPKKKSAATYHCRSVRLAGRRLTFDGDEGPISVKAGKVAIPPGTYTVRRGRGGGTLLVEATGGTQTVKKGQVLTYSWDVVGTREQREAFAEKVDGYVASLTSAVPLTVSATQAGGASDITVIDETGTGSGTGAGAGTGGGGGQQQKQEQGGQGGDGGGGGQKGGQAGGTGQGTGRQQQGTTGTGGTGGTQGEKVDPKYQEKLQKLFDGPVEATIEADKLRELQKLLDQLSLDDIALFKRSSVKVSGGDVEGLLQSLRLFTSTKELYEQADKQGKLQKPEVTDESQKLLTDAMKQYSDKMSADDKERLARATIEALSNRQLKNLSAKQIAEGIIRVDQQVMGAGEEMSGGLNQALEDRGWGKVAGVARGVKGAAGFWAILAMGAMLVAAFVPGLNVAVLAAHAMAAGMVAFAAASIQQESEIQAARGAKSQAEMERRIVSGAQARTEKIMAGVAMAMPVALKYLGKLPVSGAIKRVRGAMDKARGLLKGAKGAQALDDARASVLAELRQAHADLQPALADYRTGIADLIKRLRAIDARDLIKEMQAAPQLQDLLTPDTIKALQKLGPKDLAIARAGIVDALQNAPAVAEQTLKALDAEVTALEANVKAASSAQELDSALKAGQHATGPENLRDVSTRAGAEVVKERIAAETKKPAAPPQPVESETPAKPPAEPEQPKPVAPAKAPKIDPLQGVKDAIERTKADIEFSKDWIAKQTKRKAAADAVARLHKQLSEMAPDDPQRPAVQKKLNAAQEGLAEQNRQYDLEGKRLSSLYDELNLLKDALNKKLYQRPSFTDAERATVWDAALKEGKGKVLSPSGKEIKPGDPWVMGHKPGWEFWKHVRSAVQRRLTKAQFNAEAKKLNQYRPETPGDNSTHGYEDRTDKYLGPPR